MSASRAMRLRQVKCKAVPATRYVEKCGSLTHLIQPLRVDNNEKNIYTVLPGRVLKTENQNICISDHMAKGDIQIEEMARDRCCVENGKSIATNT